MSSFVTHPADNTAIATIRTLAADVVGKANSGHPGQSLFILRVVAELADDRPAHQVPPWAWHPPPMFSFRGALSSRIYRVHRPSLLSPITRFVNANPKNSKWFNRDRFVLSNG